MTKREIFERLQNIRDYARVTDTWPHDNAEEQNLRLRNAVDAIAKDLGDLLLDLAAPEEKPKADAPKAEEKHPGVIVPVNKKYPATCLKCGGEAEIVDNMFGTSDDWAYCPKCGCAYRIKRGKDL